MRSLLITSFFPPVHGGSAVVYGNLFKYGNGQIDVLTADYDCQYNTKISDADAVRKEVNGIHTLKLLRAPYILSKSKIHSLYLLLRHDLVIVARLAFYLYRLMKKHKYSNIIIGELHSLSWCGKLVKLLFPHCCVVNYIHGEELTTAIPSKSFQSNIRKKLVDADAIVCVSSFTKDVLLKELAMDKSKVKLISNGIDLEPINSLPKEPKVKQAPNIFAMGRHIERKGFDMLIKSMPLVLKKLPDATLFLGGQGPETANYELLVEQLELKKSVKILGRLSETEVEELYGSSFCFSMPNRTLENGDTEGFGLVFLEANARGLPVVGGRAGGAVDAVLDNETGFLVNGKSTNEIANALISLYENKDRHKEMSVQGVKWAQSNDVKIKVKEFLDFLQSLHANK